MDRRALELLSSTVLQHLIADAAAELAERHVGAESEETKEELKNAKKVLGKKQTKSDARKESCRVLRGRGAKRGLDASEEAGASELPGFGSAAPPPLAPPSRQSVSGNRGMRGRRKSDARHSGVRGVFWNRNAKAWNVEWTATEGGQARKRRLFAVQHYVENGQGSYEEADAEALRDAVAFRKDLVRRGVVKVARTAQRQSCSRGVSWESRGQGWRVQMRSGGRRINFHFRPKDNTPEEVERARLAAVERRRELEAEHCEVVVPRDEQRPRETDSKDKQQPREMKKKPARRLVVQRRKDTLRHEVAKAAKAAKAAERQSSGSGVSWDAQSKSWQILVCIGGKRRSFYVHPEDDSVNEVERARLAAVERLRELEAEDGKVGARKDEQTHGMKQRDDH